MGFRVKRKKRASKMQIVRQARALFARQFREFRDVPGSCVYQAAALVQVGREHGRRIIVQAGSAFWRRLPVEVADWVENTAWGYEYDPSTFPDQFVSVVPTREAHLSGRSNLPMEIHVWCAQPDTDEIIDITTGGWPRACEMIGGLDWPGPKPPDYLWKRAGTQPEGGIYCVDPDATRRAHDAVNEVIAHWDAGIQIVPTGGHP